MAAPQVKRPPRNKAGDCTYDVLFRKEVAIIQAFRSSGRLPFGLFPYAVGLWCN